MSTIKKFNRLLDKKQKKKLIILFFLMLLSTVLEVMSVSMMVPIITVIMDEKAVEKNVLIQNICSLLHIGDYKTFVVVCILGLIFLYIFKDLFVIFQHYIQVRFVCNSRLAMQKRLLHTIINRPYEFYLNISTGEINQMVLHDANGAYNLLYSLLCMITEVVVSLALAITVFIIEPFMTGLVVVILGACMMIIARVARPKIKRAGIEYRKNGSRLSSWVVQIVNGIKEIKITQKELFFEKEYANIAKKGIRAEKLYKTINGIPKSLIEMAAVSGALTALLFMLVSGRNLESLIPALSAFAVAAVKLLPSVNKIATCMNDITYAQPYLDKLLSNLETIQNEKAAEDVNGEELPTITLNENVRLEDMSYHYPNTERFVVEHADMEVPVGKSIGIVGSSGSGKTTTVDIILGLLQPQAGRILADGKDVLSNYDGWLSNIGYIPQSIFMLDGSIRDNVAFGVPKDKVDDEKVWAAIKEAQLEEYVKSLPEGLDSSVGERGIRISGGQKQRIGIARALYNDPALLVFDEATSALDNETEAAIMESINMLHGKKTMIIIAHRLQTISGCDMVYRVEDGKIRRER